MRFYANEFPEVGSTVVVTVTAVDNTGVRCTLDEYDGMEGYARLVDMKRVRSVRTLNAITRVGKKEFVEVTDVDRGARVVDVSRNMVTDDEREACIVAFHRAKKVSSILGYVARKHAIDNIAERLGWPDFAALAALKDGGELKGYAGLPDDARATLAAQIAKKLTERDHVRQVVRTVDLRCLGPDGVVSVQKAIRAGLAAEPDQAKITVRRIPDYDVLVKCVDQADGDARMAAVLDATQATIEAEAGGRFALLGTRRRGAPADASEALRYSASVREML